ncbi:BamA/TamA family outer membrane protein [Riemerella columbina]|uniref:BamA/TamA family outer membrane protein n=1 Tax=Riemerella columbina TaxID=103810 RepID=UPI0026700B96|nr:BamA/TamA family outer membrane protein [Riemerella columbina]WKS94777.1 BamA/TamA family outer membrane protein [Riemerella columbina]
MIKQIRLIFLILCSVWAKTQQLPMVLIDQETQQKVLRKDSLAAAQFLDSLVEQHYYFAKVLRVEQKPEQIEILYDKGKNYNQAWVVFSPEIMEKLQFPTPYFTPNLEALKHQINQKYIDEGYAFSRVKTQYLRMKDEVPEVKISLVKTEKRTIDGFQIRGYERLPKRVVKNLERQFVGKTYEPQALEKIMKVFQNHQFVALERSPQTLFTADSTQVFLFLKKKKANYFDGVLGFGNNDSEKISLTGSLNFNFKNIFNAFETVHFFWQKNPNGGQTFNLETELPYILNSDVGAQFQMNIFRQDSTFANVKIQPSLYYQWQNQHKIGLKGHFELSSALQERTTAKNFNKKGVGLWYEFEQNSPYELLLYQTKVKAEASALQMQDMDAEQHFGQQYYEVFGEHNIRLKGRHFLNVKAEMVGISTPEQLSVNEMLRLGGWNSLRGFNENSLLAQFYAYGSAEYRYLIGNQAFFDVFTQLAHLQNPSFDRAIRLYSIGTGFRIKLPLGIMSFQISNGTAFGEPLRFKDTKIHWGILAQF